MHFNERAEYIDLQNRRTHDLDLTGWVIVSVRRNQRFYFSNYVLKSNSSVVVGDLARNNVDFHRLTSRRVGIIVNPARRII